jgi:hypothetical protein
VLNLKIVIFYILRCQSFSVHAEFYLNAWNVQENQWVVKIAEKPVNIHDQIASNISGHPVSNFCAYLFMKTFSKIAYCLFILNYPLHSRKSQFNF